MNKLLIITLLIPSVVNAKTIDDGKVEQINDSATHSDITVMRGGTLYLSNGTVNNIIVDGGSFSTYAAPEGATLIINNMTLKNKGTFYTKTQFPGGEINKTIIDDNGFLSVSSGALASGTIIKNGGIQKIIEYNNPYKVSDRDTDVNQGGIQHIVSGTSESTEVSGLQVIDVWDADFYSADASDDSNKNKYQSSGNKRESAISNNAMILQGGVQFVHSGESKNATIYGKQIVDGGLYQFYNGEWTNKKTSDNDIDYRREGSPISTNAIIKNDGEQRIENNGRSEGSEFNDSSSQYIGSNSSSTTTTLKDKSTSLVMNAGSLLGITSVNNSAKINMTTGKNDESDERGAYAERVVLSSKESVLNIKNSESGDFAFVNSIEGLGNVSLLDSNHNRLITDSVSGATSFTFNTDIENNLSSNLIINKSSEGSHIVNVKNNGGQSTTGKERVTLIEDNSGNNAKATFTSGNVVELGGYSYSVQKDGSKNNWILAAEESSPAPTPKPVINDTAKTITGLASTSYLMNQAEMNTLRQRMGDLTRASATAQSDVSGAWGRIYGGKYKTSNNDNLAKASMNYYGFQLGGDINTVHYSNSKNYLGVFAGHTTGKPDYVRGDATATSWYGGVYDTFIADNGFYVDSVVKVGQYRNHYNLKDSQDNGLNGKGLSNVMTLSSQAGKRFTLTENDDYNVYAEPQAQLTYSRIGSFNTTASNGLRVKQGAYNSTVARIGAVLGTQINRQSDIYLKTSYLHEFSKDVDYTLNDSRESYGVKGDGLEAGIGMNVKLNDNGYLYAEGDYINSKTHYTGSKFNIGYRYSF